MTIKYDLTGFYNFREGGGMPADGGRVRTERLLRSDFPSSLDDEDIEFLREVPVAVVVDLRTDQEIQASPEFFADAGLDVQREPILAGSIQSMLTETPTVESMYLTMLQQAPTQIAAAVGKVASAVPDGAALVHCTAGKDRTGIVIALTQAVLGVSDDDIVANYVQTEQNLQGPWLNQKLAQIKPLLAKAPAGQSIDVDKLIPIMSQSPAPAIEAVLAQVRKEYGSVDQFLLANGVTQDQLDALKAHLVETA